MDEGSTAHVTMYMEVTSMVPVVYVDGVSRACDVVTARDDLEIDVQS